MLIRKGEPGLIAFDHFLNLEFLKPRQPVVPIDFLLRAALPPLYAKNHDYWAALTFSRAALTGFFNSF
jgi:hypothetical protein